MMTGIYLQSLLFSLLSYGTAYSSVCACFAPALNYTSILSVCGKLENRTTIDRASSRSRIASIKVGYLQIHRSNFAEIGDQLKQPERNDFNHRNRIKKPSKRVTKTYRERVIEVIHRKFFGLGRFVLDVFCLSTIHAERISISNSCCCKPAVFESK